jgi:DNA-binding HxlR family transcriptional regulator
MTENNNHSQNGLINAFVFGILKSLKDDPRRFSDFCECCPNETTRSKKLKELEHCGLIEQKLQKNNGNSKNYVHYSLTEKGKKVLQLLEEIHRLCD